MRIVTAVKALQRLSRDCRRQGRSIGFVPTMGALHAGHAALLRRCRRENDVSVLSVFVNPRQFGPTEDHAAYPRNKKSDCRLAKKENVDIMLFPSADEMYPEPYLTTVDVKEISATLCGASRPGHFPGVATVVCKLLNIVMPDNLYLGQKDAQQCAVIRQMTRDLNMPVRVRVCPTVRGKDGLALSSRNQYLSPAERAEAPALYRSLTLARDLIRRGERRAAVILRAVRKLIASETAGIIDYVACVDGRTLKPLQRIEGEVLIALAVKFGKARLIDNIILRVPPSPHPRTL